MAPTITTPFVLPRFTTANVSLKHMLLLKRLAEISHFSTRVIAWAMSSAFTDDEIQRKYLSSFKGEDLVKIGINEVVNCEILGVKIPILFFAVERRSVAMIRSLVAEGARLDDKIALWNISLLQYTVMLGAINKEDMTEIFRLLLDLGANAHGIPIDMWERITDDPQQKLVQERDMTKEVTPEDYTYNTVAQGLNLSMRYFLWRRCLSLKVGKTEIQSLALFDISSLRELSLLLIGQTIATEMTKLHLLGAYAENKSHPIVLVFTGGPGLGKTELAGKAAALLNTPFIDFDCAELSVPSDLFGDWPPSEQALVGSQLNNFLAEAEGERKIVFLDHFDKTTQTVRDSLFALLTKGRYTDHRNYKKVDVGDTIWIMAVNEAEERIAKFQKEYPRFQEQIGLTWLEQSAWGIFQDDLNKELASALGDRMSSCVTTIVPFFPFTSMEQAVIVHQRLLSEISMVRKPVLLAKPRHNLMGDFHVNIPRDGEYCVHLAHQYYRSSGNARSLHRAVDTHFTTQFLKLFMKNDLEIERRANADKVLRTVNLGFSIDKDSLRVTTVLREGTETTIEEHARVQERLLTKEQCLWLKL